VRRPSHPSPSHLPFRISLKSTLRAFRQTRRPL